MTSEVHKLLTTWDTAFRSGDRALYTTARADLRRGIRTAKLAYKDKTEYLVSNNNPRSVWQGLQHLSNYKGSQKAATTLSCLYQHLQFISQPFHRPPSSEVSNNHPCPKETILKQPSRLQTCGPHPTHNGVF